jgi:hypothetical protein
MIETTVSNFNKSIVPCLQHTAALTGGPTEEILGMAGRDTVLVHGTDECCSHHQHRPDRTCLPISVGSG